MKKRTRYNQPTFSRIICSSPQVLGAFGEHAPTSAWWNLILKLHGKPTEPSLVPEERTRRVAEGFRFYAALYRGLSVLFALLCPTLAALSTMEHSSFYTPAASCVACVYLWFVSGLGFAGARSYARGKEQGRVSLLAFMVMIVAFLSVFVGATSIAAQDTARLPSGLNLLSSGALLVLGVGSYFIEIVYLATVPGLSDISRA